MPIIPIYSGQLARQDPNEPDPNSPWNGLDEKIMRGLMVGTQLKKAGIEARAAEQDIQAKQQAMGMAVERQGWARQEQGWKAQEQNWKAKEQDWRESERERTERLRAQGGEAAMNLYNIQYGEPENLAAQGMGGDWAVSTGQAQEQNTPEAQAEFRRQRGLEYASTLDPELQKTFLEGLNKAVHGRLLGDSAKSAAGYLQNFIGDLDASDASGKYDPEIKGFQQRLDALNTLPPEQAYEESLRLRKEMAATKEIIKNEEFRIAKIPGALDSVNNIVQNMKATGNWENNPNRGSIDQIMKSLLYDRSTVDPDKALADAEQLARGYRKWQDTDPSGKAREFWVSDKQYSDMMADKIQREAVERENQLNRALRRQEAVGRFITSAMNVAGRAQAAQSSADAADARAAQGQSPKPATLTPKQMSEIHQSLQADEETTYPQYDDQTFAELSREQKQTIVQDMAQSMLSRVNKANQQSFEQMYPEGRMQRVPGKTEAGESQQPAMDPAQREALLRRLEGLTPEQMRYILEQQQKLQALQSQTKSK